ncbi:MAG: endonuclease MutS2, partial [Caldilineae bacterium]
MHTKSLTTLEYPKILKRLAAHTTFSVAAELAEQLRPTPHYTEALERQAETAEARRLLAEQPDTGVGGARDVRPLLEQARRAIPIPPQGFLTLAHTLIAARNLRRKLTRLEDRYPRLADIAWRLEENSGLIHHIHQTVDDAGRILDTASSELARIRREAEIAHSRLQEKMRRLLASEKVSPYLQENLITQRDGRYVLPLKAEFKGRIRGIIHDQSASGATLFIEPASVVELNNRWRQLQLEEEQEIHRILQALTAQVAERSKFIAATVQALAELDLLFAKARYAEAMDAVSPRLVDPAAPPAPA